jgi:hypothetical protein
MAFFTRAWHSTSLLQLILITKQHQSQRYTYALRQLAVEPNFEASGSVRRTKQP